MRGEYDLYKYIDFWNSVVSTFSSQFLGHTWAKRCCGTAESAADILKGAHLPNSLGNGAIAAATHIHICSQTSAAGDIPPYEHFYGQKLDVLYFRVFGCLGYIHILRKMGWKL